MKRFITAFAFLLFCAAMAYAQDTGSVLDYGTRVNIGSGIETSLDLSYHQDPNTYGFPAARNVGQGIISNPVWTPNGERIFFTDGMNIFSIPVSGGTPRLEFESNMLYPYNGKQFILQEHITSLTGISPDGKKLYFIRIQLGEGSGAVITIDDHIAKDGGWGSQVSGGVSALECLDLDTGSVTTLAQGQMMHGSLSRSGRYLVFFDYIVRATRIQDLTSGEEWNVPELSLWTGISADEQSILFATVEGDIPKFSRIPIRGGEPEQFTSPLDVTGTPAYPNWGPDGEWVIYTLITGESFSNSGTSAEGRGWSFKKGVEKLLLSNLSTGQTAEIVPFSKSIDAEMARFSPDGKQICYIRRDCENPDDEWAIYTKDISLPATELGGQVSVADAKPAGFALTGNYPNPFNPSTHIAFSIPASGAVKLSVYDVTGRKVWELVSSAMTAGAHEMVWDGRDESGATVSSGTYIARLKMGNFTDSHRMLLMK